MNTSCATIEHRNIKCVTSVRARKMVKSQEEKNVINDFKIRWCEGLKGKKRMRANEREKKKNGKMAKKCKNTKIKKKEANFLFYFYVIIFYYIIIIYYNILYFIFNCI